MIRNDQELAVMRERVATQHCLFFPFNLSPFTFNLNLPFGYVRVPT